jgi:hypothetical protein
MRSSFGYHKLKKGDRRIKCGFILRFEPVNTKVCNYTRSWTNSIGLNSFNSTLFYLICILYGIHTNIVATAGITNVPNVFLSLDPIYKSITNTFQSEVSKIRAREVKVKQSLYRPRQAPRFRGGCDSKISRQLAYEGGKVVNATKLPENIPGTHFYYRLSLSHGDSAAGRIMAMKNSNDSIGNRIRNLPAGSEVPQPAAPTSVHKYLL